jgi:hypothetical protein
MLTLNWAFETGYEMEDWTVKYFRKEKWHECKAVVGRIIQYMNKDYSFCCEMLKIGNEITDLSLLLLL